MFADHVPRPWLRIYTLGERWTLFLTSSFSSPILILFVNPPSFGRAMPLKCPRNRSSFVGPLLPHPIKARTDDICPVFTFAEYFTRPPVWASQQPRGRSAAARVLAPGFGGAGARGEPSGASAAKGRAQHGGQGIPTSATGAGGLEDVTRALPAPRCQGRLARGALQLPVPA